MSCSVNIETNLEKKKSIVVPPFSAPPKRHQSNKSNPGLCRRLSDCIVMGPASSPRHVRLSRQEANQKLDQLALEVEVIGKQLQKQKDLTVEFKTKLEQTQVFLRYCLGVAQEKGFLEQILNNIKDDEQIILQDFSSLTHYSTIRNSSTNIVASSSPAALDHCCQSAGAWDLSALVHEAKTNGWYIAPHEIEMQHLSAQGSTAAVYRGKWRGLNVAIKCMYLDFLQSNENGVSFFAQEVETLSRQRHPYVLQLIGASLDPPEHCWIVTEFFGTTLKDWLHGPGKRQKERTNPLPHLRDRIIKALEISQAMQYLHESKPKMILHRDLKPSNIFLDDAFHVKVTDFGHARYLADGEKALTGETGTFVYMAPEVIRCAPYDEKCDVYSFGVILNELITGEYPYIDKDYGPSKIAYEVAENGLRPTVVQPDIEESDILIELIEQSWHQKPANRPTFGEINSVLRIVENRLFRDLNFHI